MYISKTLKNSGRYSLRWRFPLAHLPLGREGPRYLENGNKGPENCEIHVLQGRGDSCALLAEIAPTQRNPTSKRFECPSCMTPLGGSEVHPLPACPNASRQSRQSHPAPCAVCRSMLRRQGPADKPPKRDCNHRFNHRFFVLSQRATSILKETSEAEKNDVPPAKRPRG